MERCVVENVSEEKIFKEQKTKTCKGEKDDEERWRKAAPVVSLQPQALTACTGMVCVAKHAYDPEALGYLHLVAGDHVVLSSYSLPGDVGCSFAKYVFVEKVADGARGWVPEDVLWERYMDYAGCPWLYDAATGGWCWET